MGLLFPSVLSLLTLLTKAVFVFWFVNNLFLAVLQLIFHDRRGRKFLGVKENANIAYDMVLERPRKKGFIGFWVDRWDYAMATWKEFQETKHEIDMPWAPWAPASKPQRGGRSWGRRKK